MLRVPSAQNVGYRRFYLTSTEWRMQCSHQFNNPRDWFKRIVSHSRRCVNTDVAFSFSFYFRHQFAPATTKICRFLFRIWYSGEMAIRWICKLSELPLLIELQVLLQGLYLTWFKICQLRTGRKWMLMRSSPLNAWPEIGQTKAKLSARPVEVHGVYVNRWNLDLIAFTALGNLRNGSNEISSS